MEICVICSKKCKTLCSACRKVYYCSSEHQKLDRKDHKKDCYPAALIVDEKQGRHFVATSELKPGDLVFKDEAVVYGPSGAEFYLHKICLGCYKVVKNCYVCSKCSWPCCGFTCESVPEHADFECKIFANGKVAPFFTAPIEYDFIKFLRTLLLRELYPTKWQQIQTLASHNQARAQNDIAKFKLLTAIEFITRVCKLQQFDNDTISHVVGVWSINSFGANPPSGPNPTTSLVSFLFPKTSLASHSCIANTRGILKKDQKNVTPTYRMELRASLKIQPNQPIFITYVDVCEGTYERREILLENYFFSCECLRCKDPTEFGTYFSAYKCQKCLIGNVIPTQPLNFESEWKCNNASTSCSPIGYPQLLTKEIKIKLDSINFNNGVPQYEKLLKENQGKVLHPNHWLMVETEYRLSQCLMRSMAKNRSHVKRLEELCEHILSVINLIQPGDNPYRGKVLFCLMQAKMVKLSPGGTKKRSQNEVNKIMELCEEVKRIFAYESEGSEEWKIANYHISQNIEKLTKNC